MNHITAQQAARAITDAAELTKMYISGQATPWVFDTEGTLEEAKVVGFLAHKHRPLTAQEVKRGERFLSRQPQQRAALVERVRQDDLKYEAELRRQRRNADAYRLKSAHAGITRIAASH